MIGLLKQLEQKESWIEKFFFRFWVELSHLQFIHFTSLLTRNTLNVRIGFSNVKCNRFSVSTLTSNWDYLNWINSNWVTLCGNLIHEALIQAKITSNFWNVFFRFFMVYIFFYNVSKSGSAQSRLKTIGGPIQNLNLRPIKANLICQPYTTLNLLPCFAHGN